YDQPTRPDQSALYQLPDCETIVSVVPIGITRSTEYDVPGPERWFTSAPQTCTSWPVVNVGTASWPTLFSSPPGVSSPTSPCGATSGAGPQAVTSKERTAAKSSALRIGPPRACCLEQPAGHE